MKFTKLIVGIFVCLFSLAIISCNKDDENRDIDSDGIANSEDNCPEVANPNQGDIDGDGVGDVCDEDIDGDGILNAQDNCPETPNIGQEDADNDNIGDICDDDTDSDNDGIQDAIDNCPNSPNPNQLDTDNDGEGDECDTDDDNDGVSDVDDNCPLVPNPEQEDNDGDGVGDICDTDDDNDGILDGDDNCPLIANPGQEDTDNDGIADACDNCPSESNPGQEDIDNDGVGDSCDPSPYTTDFPCIDGMAGPYPCNAIDVMGSINTEILGGSSASNIEGSDIWGWTDPTTNKEYALVGLTNTTAFVDVTDPFNPIFLGRLNSSAGINFWRDVKVYNNHAFIVADNVGAHGMQVFDLTRLRNVTNPPEIFTVDALYTGVGSCHNIVINESEAVAYLVGCTSTNGGGPIFVDISNPMNPTFLGDYTAGGYSHDAQVVTYTGPDQDYQGKEIYVGSNGNTDKVVILDVTDKSNVIAISDFTYPQTAYAHQGWFTEDQRYFILGDEIDERTFGFNSKTLVFDFSDLDNPILSANYFGPTEAIDHNGYVKGNEYYLANYRAGLRILDISNISSTTNPMTETHFIDTYLPDNDSEFNGVWSVYPYFASGNILIGDIERGLIIVKKSL